MTQALPNGSFIDAEGVFNQLLHRAPPRRPALFLDRDGVIVVGVDYLHRPADAVLIPGVAEVIAKANAAHIAVVVVTNQSGIGRGLYDWRHFAETQEKIITDLARQGARIDAVFACPHHPSARGSYAHPDHPARKPNPGMLIRAERALDVDMAASWIVGDRADDVRAGRRAGLAGGLHVASGHGSSPQERQRAGAEARPRFMVRFAPSAAEASTLPLFEETQDAS